jgi:threonine/homoserine/homoserine lactone efflux protein
VAGTSTAMLIQLALTVAGMTAMLNFLAEWFEWNPLGRRRIPRLFGAEGMARRAVGLTNVRAGPASVRTILARGFFVSITNPKTLLFYGAFSATVRRSRRGPHLAVILLSATFVVIAVGSMAAGRCSPVVPRGAIDAGKTAQPPHRRASSWRSSRAGASRDNPSARDPCGRRVATPRGWP